MKKIVNVFAMLFGFVLLCSNNLFAQAGSYETVTGIDNPADANGRYNWVANDGPDGRPRYQHTSGNYHIYASDEGGIIWFIDDDFDPYPTFFYCEDDAMMPPAEGYWEENASGYPQLDFSLSVELSSFSAQVIDQSVHLQWLTESEVDNLGFILERSQNDSSWVTIASHQTHDALKSQGNTSNRTKYVFTDNNVEPGKDYWYRLSDVDTNGEITLYAPLFIKMADLPVSTVMENAYPNPFNPQTYIAYHLAKSENVNISVFDLLGRRITTLLNGQQPAGSYHIYWNGSNEYGLKVSSGSYIIRLQTKNMTQIQKVIFMK